MAVPHCEYTNATELCTWKWLDWETLCCVYFTAQNDHSRVFCSPLVHLLTGDLEQGCWGTASRRSGFGGGSTVGPFGSVGPCGCFLAVFSIPYPCSGPWYRSGKLMFLERQHGIPAPQTWGVRTVAGLWPRPETFGKSSHVAKPYVTSVKRDPVTSPRMG